VDELRLRYTWKPMKDAPEDREVLFRYIASDGEIDVVLGFVSQHSAAYDWMEIPW